MRLIRQLFILSVVSYSCVIWGIQPLIIKDGSTFDLDGNQKELDFEYHYPGYGNHPSGRKQPNQTDCFLLTIEPVMSDLMSEKFLNNIEIFDGFGVLSSDRDKNEDWISSPEVNRLSYKRLNPGRYVFHIKDVDTYVTGLLIKTKSNVTFDNALVTHFHPLRPKVNVTLLRKCPLQ